MYHVAFIDSAFDDIYTYTCVAMYTVCACFTTVFNVFFCSPTKSVRPIGVGQTYTLPPPLSARKPSTTEQCADFIEYISRVPTLTLKKALVSCYQVRVTCLNSSSSYPFVSTFDKGHLAVTYTQVHIMCR
jgi:hypothetical protein